MIRTLPVVLKMRCRYRSVLLRLLLLIHKFDTYLGCSGWQVCEVPGFVAAFFTNRHLDVSGRRLDGQLNGTPYVRCLCIDTRILETESMLGT
jgi:hypothetical protein